MSQHKRTNRPGWGTTDPRPINQRRPRLNADTGLPAVGTPKPRTASEILERVRARHAPQRHGR